MVYLLPIHSPLRIIEEICILDHLSHGRLEVGVGRGVSPFELNFHKVDPERSREIFIDAFDCMLEGLTHDRLTYHGPYYNYDDVPMPLSRCSSRTRRCGTDRRTRSARRGRANAVCTSRPTAATERAKANIAAYREALAKRGRAAAQPRAEFAGGAAIGDHARDLRRRHRRRGAPRSSSPRTTTSTPIKRTLRREARGGPRGKSGDRRAADRRAPANSTTRSAKARRSSAARQRYAPRSSGKSTELGLNYLIGYFMFGTLTLADALRSLELFTSDVKPALERLYS